MSRTASEIQVDIDKLEEFADAYRFYFGAPDNKGDVPKEFVGNRATLRQLLHRRLGPAERIMQAAGTNGIGVMPPPAIGGPGRHGLAATAFAEEQALFRGMEPPIHMSVLDAVELTIGVLEDELKSAGSPGSSSSTAASTRAPISAVKLAGQHRFPRLILERLRSNVPKWALLIERLVLFLAGVAAIVLLLGTIFGWWSNA